MFRFSRNLWIHPADYVTWIKWKLLKNWHWTRSTTCCTSHHDCETRIPDKQPYVVKAKLFNLHLARCLCHKRCLTWAHVTFGRRDGHESWLVSHTAHDSACWCVGHPWHLSRQTPSCQTAPNSSGPRPQGKEILFPSIYGMYLFITEWPDPGEAVWCHQQNNSTVHFLYNSLFIWWSQINFELAGVVLVQSIKAFQICITCSVCWSN